MTRVKLDTPAFADQSVDTRTIKDGTIIAQDVSGSLTNAKLANSSITINGTAVSLGGSGTFFPLVEWQAVTVADGSTTLTAEAGKGYFLDTNTGVIEVFLPTSPSRGDTIILVDYSGTFATNQAIINTGGQLIDSTTGPDFKLTTNNTIAELVYIDANKGWQVILNQAAGTTPSSILTVGGSYGNESNFIQATGGTVTTSGDFKIHTFTGDGIFDVTFKGIGTPDAPDAVDYLVIAGGGGSGFDTGGGGGAGGYRASGFGPSPLRGTAITLTSSSFPITVGGGGTGGTSCAGVTAQNGSNSIFSTITSAGGGGAGRGGATVNSSAGGSGAGGGAHPSSGKSGGAGNTPPVSPSQGNNGGNGATGTGNAGGGGGGAGAAGQNGTFQSSPLVRQGGNGGSGVPNTITGSDVSYAGGGGGGGVSGAGSGAPGGGGGGATSGTGQAGTANKGGGGGAGGPSNANAGGKGIVIIRYKFQ